MRNAVGNRRVDGVLADVALGAEVVVAGAVFWQGAALLLHLVGVLPGADDDLAHAAHGLAVAAHHADGAQVMQDIFSRNRFFADAAFSKGQVFGNRRVQVVADHQHVHMLVQRVDGVGHGRVGGRWQKVRLADHAHDVRRMATARAFGVKGAQAAALGGLDGVFHNA